MWVRFTHRCAVWVFVSALQMQKKKSVHEHPISLASLINLSLRNWIAKFAGLYFFIGDFRSRSTM